MPSKHKEAHAFLKKGFFEGLKTFRDFETRTEQFANTKEVGDAFEILVEAYLYLNPVMRAKNVWLVGDVPLSIRSGLNLPADSKGIDGVYEDASGNLIPYQAKYRSDRDTLSYTEVSSFLGVTEKSLRDRVILTNARELATDVANREGLRSVRAAQFNCLSEDDFSRIQSWLCDIITEAKRWDPMPHQKDAVEKITLELAQASRTTAVMACGTGKTLVALWVAESIQPKTVLVLVPSLALISQTLAEWCSQTLWGDRLRYLCVCSDDTVDESKINDTYRVRQSDVEFSVTTKADVVVRFLHQNASGVNVIFSTYHSIEIVAAGLKGIPIDFGVFDEAHKTTGSENGLFAFGLRDKNLFIKNRLFLTATPRHYDLRKRDKEGDFRIVSMDDESLYGKVSYRLSFSAAAENKIIVPYKVILSVSLNKVLDDELLRTGSTLVRKNEIQARWVANQIALKCAINKTSASKIITFHSRVELAQKFASDSALGIGEHLEGFSVFHVNGRQSASERKHLMDSFKDAPKGLITNARCLTEGVDVPAIDMVAFIDPKKSKVDIAQAAGRAMRQSKATGKTTGYIVVPVFVEQKLGETETEAVARSDFAEVVMVLGAMLDNDDDLVDIVREMQEAEGRGAKFNPHRLHERIEVVGPSIDLNELRKSIDVLILSRLGIPWDKWYGLLELYYKRVGHTRVPDKHIEGELKLGVWVSKQRLTKETLTHDRIMRLDRLGFSWDPLADRWEENFAALVQFKKSHGHVLVTQTNQGQGSHLCSWVVHLRSRKGTLTRDQLMRLDSLGFIWDPITEQWERGYEALCAFQKRVGHVRVFYDHVEMGMHLGHWVSLRRNNKDKLTADQLERLDKLGFNWDPLNEAWQDNMDALDAFYTREGHYNVLVDHIENGLKLGNFVRSLRQGTSVRKPTADEKNRLTATGFSWLPSHRNGWISKYELLKIYYDAKGHTDLNTSNCNDIALINWATFQRTKRKKGKLNAGQIEKLNAINFSWDLLGAAFEASFAALQKYYTREGNTDVPPNHMEDGINLGNWVQNKRAKMARNTITKLEVEKLNILNFVWDNRASFWLKNFQILERYCIKHGGPKAPPINYMEDGVKHGIWFSNQRRRANRLTAEQVKLIRSLGFDWNR